MEDDVESPSKIKRDGAVKGMKDEEMAAAGTSPSKKRKHAITDTD